MRLHTARALLRAHMSDVSILTDGVSQSRFRAVQCGLVKRALSLSFAQVVQEYERAVMFRLGRILGGAKVGLIRSILFRS